jgi:hypothetical protein
MLQPSHESSCQPCKFRDLIFPLRGVQGTVLQTRKLHSAIVVIASRMIDYLAPTRTSFRYHFTALSIDSMSSSAVEVVISLVKNNTVSEHWCYGVASYDGSLYY